MFVYPATVKLRKAEKFVTAGSMHGSISVSAPVEGLGRWDYWSDWNGEHLQGFETSGTQIDWSDWSGEDGWGGSLEDHGGGWLLSPKVNCSAAAFNAMTV